MGQYRIMVAFRREGQAVFLYGFAKNEQDNTGQDELVSLREIAAMRLDTDAERITRTIAEKELCSGPINLFERREAA